MPDDKTPHLVRAAFGGIETSNRKTTDEVHREIMRRIGVTRWSNLREAKKAMAKGGFSSFWFDENPGGQRLKEQLIELKPVKLKSTKVRDRRFKSKL